jgi:uncharacterized protein
MHKQMSLKKQRLIDIYSKYQAHPEFLGIEITNPNQRGAVDDTLLHLASRTGSVDDIKVLIDAGADINVSGDLGNTPLHQAAMTGQIESVKLLLRLGAKRNLLNEFDQTPLDVAELSGRPQMIKLLKR